MPPKTRRVVCVEPTGRHSIRFAVHCFVSRRKHVCAFVLEQKITPMSSDGTHNQKKTAAPRSAAELAKTAQRIADYRSKWDRMASVDVATLDDSSLALTTAVLDMNPDAYAAWNLRRRILSCLWAPKNDEEAVHQMAKADLKWIEKLVRSYPKSYWLWVHRGWLLDNMHQLLNGMPKPADPDWDRELILCQAMLDMDARNFHGWDYRRAILKKSGRTADASELEYTAAKIRQNFSNYSAWHYRGKLIARSAMADAERDAVVQKDFETVRNAIYTEPADQSAWLYQRWLLGEKEAPLSVEWAHLEATSDQEAILFVSFNHPVLIDDTQVSLSPSKTDLATPSLRAASHVYTRRISHLTRSPLTVTLPVSAFKLFPKPFPGQHLHIAFEAPSNQGRAAFTGSSKDPSATSETRMQPREVWTREMQSIRELVDVEPESKWALTSLVHCLRALCGHDAEVLEILDTLGRVDPDRAGLYADLASDVKWRALLAALPEDAASLTVPEDARITRIEASHVLPPRIEKVFLKGNRLRGSVPVFPCVRELEIESGGVEWRKSVKGMPLLRRLLVGGDVVFDGVK